MTRTLCLMFLLLAITPGCGKDASPGAGDDDTNSSAGAGTSEDANGSQFDLPARSKNLPLPDDLPDDVPIYPGSRLTLKDDSQPGYRNAYRMSMVLETTDSLDKVREFFKTKIGEHEWKLDKESPNSFDAVKEERTFHVYFMEMPAKPGSVSLNVVYTQPQR